MSFADSPICAFQFRGRRFRVHENVLRDKLPYIAAAYASATRHGAERRIGDVNFDPKHPDHIADIGPYEFAALVNWAYSGNPEELHKHKADVEYWTRVTTILGYNRNPFNGGVLGALSGVYVGRQKESAIERFGGLIFTISAMVPAICYAVCWLALATFIVWAVSANVFYGYMSLKSDIGKVGSFFFNDTSYGDILNALPMEKRPKALDDLITLETAIKNNMFQLFLFLPTVLFSWTAMTLRFVVVFTANISPTTAELLEPLASEFDIAARAFLVNLERLGRPVK